MNKNMLIAVIVVLLGVVGYFVYQDQQKESVSISVGDKKLEIEAH